jgi:hypothetical protein
MNDLEAYNADPWGYLVGHAAQRIDPGYVPSYVAQRNPIDNPAGDAAARLHETAPDNAQALANKFLPESPLDAVEPKGSAIPVQGFAEGGAALEKALSFLTDKLHSAGDVLTKVRPGSGLSEHDLLGMMGADAKSPYRLIDYPLDWLSLDDQLMDPQKISDFAARPGANFNPILLDSYGSILDGRHRMMAAKSRGDDAIAAFAPQSLVDAIAGQPKMAEGGSLLEKIAQLAARTLKPAARATESAPLSNMEHFDLMRRFGSGPDATNRLSLEEMNRLIGGLSRSPSEAEILGQPHQLPLLTDAQVGSLLEPPSTHLAEGGSTDDPEAQAQFNAHSSLRALADAARALHPPSNASPADASQAAEDRARIASNLASLLYGLDAQGHPVFGGRAWTKSQGGTPMAALDAIAAVPHGAVQTAAELAHLADLGRQKLGLSGKSIPASFWASIDPSWSAQAAQRLARLRQQVQQTAGTGQDKSLEGQLIDAVVDPAVIAPLGVAGLAGKGSLLRKALPWGVEGTEDTPPTTGAH